MTEAPFPLWAFIAQMAAISLGITLLGLLSRRLRLVHPVTWERLGRPSLMMLPGSIIGFFERGVANIRLVVFPFRSPSFQLSDPGTAFLLWLLRATLGLLAVFSVWSLWANH